MVRPSAFTNEEDEIILDLTGANAKYAVDVLKARGFKARTARQLDQRRYYLNTQRRSVPASLGGLEQSLEETHQDIADAQEQISSLTAHAADLRAAIAAKAAELAG